MVAEKRSRFKTRKLKTVLLGEGGEIIGKEVISGYTQAPGTNGEDAKSGAKRKAPPASMAMPESKVYEASEAQKWAWSNVITDWFDFKKMVGQHQQQGGIPEVEFVVRIEEDSGKHRCDARTKASGLTQNTAFSSESAEDATQKAAQMNLYTHDAFPVPPTGEHEVWAGIRFSNCRMSPEYTFKRWLLSHLLDQTTDMDSFQFPTYIKTMKKVDTGGEKPLNAWYASVMVDGEVHSSGGVEKLFDDGRLAENCAALQALVKLGVAKQQEFQSGRLVLPAGAKVRNPLPEELEKKYRENVPQKKSETKTPGQGTLPRDAYLEKLKEELTKHARKMRCPPPEMFTVNNPDGSFTSTLTVNWNNYMGHQPVDWKAMTQAAEAALVQLKLLKKEDARYPKNLPWAQPPTRGGPPNRGQMRGGPPHPMRGSPLRPPPGAFARGRGMPGMRGMPPRGPMNAPGLMRGMPRQRGVPARGMPTRGMPTRGMPTRGMPTRGMPTRGMPTRGMPMRGMPTRGMPTRGGRGGMAARGRPKALPRTGFNDPSTLTWATVKQVLKEYLEQKGEDLPTYNVGMSEEGLYTAIVSFHYIQPRSYTGRQQYTKMAAEQDASECALVGIGYLSERMLGDQPSVPHAVSAKRNYTVPYETAPVAKRSFTEYEIDPSLNQGYGGGYYQENQVW